MAQIKIHGLAERLNTVKDTETPRGNWGFRGQTGDEVGLDYKGEV